MRDGTVLTESLPIQRGPTVADEVYARLRHQLLLGRLEPGSPLREVEVAASFAVSRTPVREAVRRLLQEGLLEAAPVRGVQVRRVGIRQALDAYAVREDLEGRAARLAAERADAAERVSLVLLLDRLEASVTDDEAAQVEADLAFHRRVADLAHAEPLSMALDGLAPYVTALKVHTRDRNAEDLTRAQHRAVTDAIHDADGDAAEAAMREHVRTFAGILAARFGALDGDAPVPRPEDR